MYLQLSNSIFTNTLTKRSFLDVAETIETPPDFSMAISVKPCKVDILSA